MVECRIRFTNTARDHRLRWNLGVQSAPRVTRAGVMFNEVTRPCARRSVENGFVIDPEHPAGQYVAVENGDAGLAVLTQLPVNYELVHGSRPRLAIAILRSVGLLSRNDMLTRGGGAGPETLTPDAQCLRSFDMTFAIRPYDVRRERRLLMAGSYQWNAIAVTGLILGFEPEIRDADHAAMLAIDSDTVVVSAFKRCHGRGGVLLRLFNAGPRATVARVHFPSAQRLVPAGLDEKPLRGSALRPRGRVFHVKMTPYSLASFLVE